MNGEGKLAGVGVLVVGLGPMGRGIARVFDRAGARVSVVDISPEDTATGLDRIRAEADKDGETLHDMQGAELADAVSQAELVVEAAVEDMAVKRQLLADIAAAGGPELVVASNTSSLSIGEMGHAFGDPARVVGMHFFNPPTKMRLVEVIVAAGTSARTADRARELVAALGKTAVTCADSPNFIVNRVCRPLYYEAQLLVSQGVEPGVVDAVACGALGHPMGPLTLLDFTGLHTHLASSETALREFGDPRYRPVPLVRRLVRSGMTGRAAGHGYYDYAAEKPRAALARVTRQPGEAGDPGVQIYRCGAPTERDLREVRDMAAAGPVVVDSSDGHWLEALPDGVGWLHLHQAPHGGVFAEVVHDEVAGIEVPSFVYAMLDGLGAAAVEVPALPGLVADRLAHCMANEASTLVEEGIATPADIDTALALGMNHPRGPFEQLAADGADVVCSSLRSMAERTGDPRYRPAQLLVRQAARR
ncbi:MAG: NADPH nitroreductase [Streptosporangiales bacterium]|nr:NADPH nitroreductase [Streptosporangiales bacterium]